MDAIPAPGEPSNPITELDQTLLVGESNPPDANEIISNRLTRLAHLSTLHEYQTHPSTLDSRTVNQCLDTLESLLDPRSNLTREIALCRPSQTRPGSAINLPKPPRKLEGPRTPPISPSSPHPRSRSLDAVSASRSARMSHDLAAVNDKVKMLGEAFLKRHEETLYIYSLYDRERKGLRHRITELEAEIEELRADMQEDLAEREALQGTVRGLEAWVDGMREEYQLALQKISTEAPSYGGRGWWKKKVNKPGGFDADTLFEGITAWMRGWTDVEEEFRNRDKARRFRRENKHQSQHRAPPDID